MYTGCSILIEWRSWSNISLFAPISNEASIRDRKFRIRGLVKSATVHLIVNVMNGLKIMSVFSLVGRDVHDILLFIYLLATLHGMRDLSSPTRDRTRAPFSGNVEP